MVDKSFTRQETIFNGGVMLKKIYIACSLTHVKKEYFDEYTSFIKELSNELEKIGIECKYALRDSDPMLSEYKKEDRAKLCYKWDRNMVTESDLVIAEASFPSIGLGMELEIANHAEIPIALIYREFEDCYAENKEYTLGSDKSYSLEIGNRIVSVMAQGCPAIIYENQYINKNDGIKCILDLIKDYNPF